VSIYLGIDPGREGAVGWIKEDEQRTIVASGVKILPYDQWGWVDVGRLVHVLSNFGSHRGPVVRVVLEEFVSKYGTAPHHLASQSYGRITALLDHLGFRWRAIQPSSWKAALGLTGAGKDGSMELAGRLLGKYLSRPLDRHDEAEALLLAWLAMNDDPNGRKTSYQDRSARAKLARMAAKMTRGKAHRSGSRSWPAKE
jgi:hypothetical protein